MFCTRTSPPFYGTEGCFSIILVIIIIIIIIIMMMMMMMIMNDGILPEPDSGMNATFMPNL